MLFLFMTSHAFSQITVNLQNKPLREALKEIEKVSDYKFFYNESLPGLKRNVTVRLTNSSIENAMEQLLSETSIKYQKKEKNIIALMEKESGRGAGTMVPQSDPSPIKGRIVDIDGEPVIGAAIVEKGNSGNGTVTDVDGNFTIDVLPGSTLRISYVGYVDQEIIATNKTTLSIVMREDTKQLDEVVVVGYGVQKKVNLTGAVASIDAKEITTRPTSNVMNALQGTIPGVTIISRPNEVSLNIRGRGNLGKSEPLYIVDGIEVNSSFFNALDPNNIETISFLKDASSAAIYGAKAAYGVVLVTTKSAKAGQLQIIYDGLYGTKSPTYLPNIVNSAQYAEMYRTAERNSGVKEENLTFNDDAIRKYKDGSDPDRYPDSNWFDLTLRKQSIFTKHNLQFMGGSDHFKYVLNTGYLRTETFTPGEATDRYSISTKTSANLKPWFTLTSNVHFIYDKYNREKGEISTIELLRVPPTQTARQSNGEWGSVRNGRQATGEEINANQLRALNENGRANSTTRRFLGSVAAEIRPFKDLKITNQIGYNYIDFRKFTFHNRKKGVPSFLNPSTGVIGGTASDVNQMDLDWNYSEKLVYDGWLNYDHTFNTLHAVSVVAGAHADTYLYKRLTVARKDFASNDMNDFTGGSTDPKNQLVTNRQDASFYEEESMNSYFGRIGYTYNQKYIFEANFRADASSRFAKGGRWGYFPSFSAGWRMDQENFMKNFTWVDGLKWRASWGKNGNIKNIGLYDTYSTYSASKTIALGGISVPILTEGRIGNTSLTWETTTTVDLGLDLSVFNGLLSLSADYYNRLTEGILIRANDIMTETGLSKDQIPARNVGKVRNDGIELVLTHTNKIGNVVYNIGFNTTINRNRIVDLGEKVDKLPPNKYWILRKGGSIGDFYMLQADGLYSSEDIANGRIIPYGQQKPGAGMVKYIDQLTIDSDGDGVFDKADGVINDKDRVVVGNDVPRFTYGVHWDLSYKNFTLSILGQGVSGVKVYMNDEASQAFFDNSVPRNWQLDHWTPENQGAHYPKLFVPANTNYKYNNHMSSFWLFDASYFRIKNITLGYTLPVNTAKKLYLKNARLFVSGDNLFTLRGDKRMKDFDPEIASGRGYAIGTKTFTAGISLTF